MEKLFVKLEEKIENNENESSIKTNQIKTDKNEIGNKKSMSYFLDFSQSSVLNGIIMAEILGEPKSRRR